MPSSFAQATFFSGEFPWRSSFHQLPKGAPWPIPIATQGSVRYIVTFTSDDVGPPPDKDPEMATMQLESDNPTRNWGYYRTFRC